MLFFFITMMHHESISNASKMQYDASGCVIYIMYLDLDRNKVTMRSSPTQVDKLMKEIKERPHLVKALNRELAAENELNGGGEDKNGGLVCCIKPDRDLGGY